MVHADAWAACFYARRKLEMAVARLYKHDRGLRLPYQDNLSALIHEPTFTQVMGEAVLTKTKVIKELGNQAVHSARNVQPADALVATRELFQISYWLAHTYGQRCRPDPGLAFNPALLAKRAAATPAVAPQTLDQLQALQSELAERDEGLATLLGPRRRWMPNWPGCARRWPPPSGPTPPHPTPTTIPKPKPVTTQSTCC